MDRWVWGDRYNEWTSIDSNYTIYDVNTKYINMTYNTDTYNMHVNIERFETNTTIWVRVVEPVDRGSSIPMPPVFKINKTYKDYMDVNFDSNPCVDTHIIIQFENKTHKWVEKFKINGTMVCL